MDELGQAVWVHLSQEWNNEDWTHGKSIQGWINNNTRWCLCRCRHLWGLKFSLRFVLQTLTDRGGLEHLFLDGKAKSSLLKLSRSSVPSVQEDSESIASGGVRFTNAPIPPSPGKHSQMSCSSGLKRPEHSLHSLSLLSSNSLPASQG